MNDIWIHKVCIHIMYYRHDIKIKNCFVMLQYTLYSQTSKSKVIKLLSTNFVLKNHPIRTLYILSLITIKPGLTDHTKNIVSEKMLT